MGCLTVNQELNMFGDNGYHQCGSNETISYAGNRIILDNEIMDH